MVKKKYSEMSELEKKRNCLAAKTVRSLNVICLIFGLIALVSALTLYAVSLVGQYIKEADNAARQAALTVSNREDPFGIASQVMSIYRNLSDEDRSKAGTDEYREFFADVDTGEGSSYSGLLTVLAETLRFNEDLYDVYIAMYDEETCTIVYIADPDDESNRMLPGDWEYVEHDGMMKFLNYNGEGILYDIDRTEKYGFMCTVAVPLRDYAGTTRCFVLADISIENVLHGMSEFTLRFTVNLIIVTILLALLLVRGLKKTVVEPVNRIADASVSYVADKRKGVHDTDHFVSLDIRTGDEIENLADTMANMERDLMDYEADLLKVTSEKERIGTELALATKIQASMLPHVFPAYPEREEFDLYAMMEPAREVGGDFYDFFLIDDDHLCMVMADVSGKGIPAALFMMISKTILQSCAMLGESAAQILKKTNEAICSNNQVEMFVTCWVGILEISTGKLIASNAGHEYPVISRAGGQFEIYKDKHGFVVGGYEESVYKEYELDLKPGDKLFLYTDGLPEATDEGEKMFGVERMLDALNGNVGSDPKTLLMNVRESVSAFVNGAEQFDDITMLCFEYKGNKQ